MSVGTCYKAVIVVGLSREEITDAPTNIQDLITKWELAVFSSDKYGVHIDDIIGLSYVYTSVFSAVDFVWDEEQILRLKNKFLMLTGLKAKIHLVTHGF
ncbi:hypothetical protein M0R04_07640 [Candidatus Dojkabacteria bacterium]|jgi:hypothetical protein|nr:hypothetical protein [Candidatus Dojkabacteria bacterium]